MTFLEAIILGIVQGLTEFLPISSSAHLRVVGELLEPGQTMDRSIDETAMSPLATTTQCPQASAIQSD